MLKTKLSSCPDELTDDERLELACASLRTAELRQPLLTELLRTVLHAPADARGRASLALLFQLACSNSGADVKMHKPAGTPCPVGVLLLGFAGANMGMLELHARTYLKLQPSWQVVVTTRPGLADPRARPALDAHCTSEPLRAAVRSARATVAKIRAEEKRVRERAALGVRAPSVPPEFLCPINQEVAKQPPPLPHLYCAVLQLTLSAPCRCLR